MPRGCLGEFRSCANGVAIQKDAHIVITVGIIGCGFVGAALKDWLEKNNRDFNAVYDCCRRMGADWARVHAASRFKRQVSWV